MHVLRDAATDDFARPTGVADVSTEPPTDPPSQPPTQPPTQPATQPPTQSPTQPPATPEWIAGSEPMWTPQPTATSTGGAVTASKSGGSGGDRGVSNGFTVVPLTVGGLLVLAAGIVSLINRPRLRD